MQDEDHKQTLIEEAEALLARGLGLARFLMRNASDNAREDWRPEWNSLVVISKSFEVLADGLHPRMEIATPLTTGSLLVSVKAESELRLHPLHYFERNALFFGMPRLPILRGLPLTLDSSGQALVEDLVPGPYALEIKAGETWREISRLEITAGGSTSVEAVAADAAQQD